MKAVALALADVRKVSLELLEAQEEVDRIQGELTGAKSRVRWLETNLRTATKLLRREEGRS